MKAPPVVLHFMESDHVTRLMPRPVKLLMKSTSPIIINGSRSAKR